MRELSQNRRLYEQALEIFRLSRNVSHYLVYDLTGLDQNGNDHPEIYFTGDIVRQSDSLAPEIIKAESQTFQDDRLKHAASLNRITQRLYTTCKRLERVESNGKDFVRLLSREVRKFRKLQHRWMMTL